MARKQVDPADYIRLQRAEFGDLLTEWERFEKTYGAAELGRCDRYYLLIVLLHRPDAWKPWLYERCREVEADPDGHLDLWAREHYKSTIITFAGIIQEILRDPEITVGIFSHTKSISRGFLEQIKREFEGNDDLKRAYPETLWEDPQKQAPKWSVDGGLIVKRKSNPKEATVEGHGLVDGQPTGKHFGLLVYDDVVTLESIGTPEQVKKTTDAWALSDNLGARDSRGLMRKWHIGTRYSYADSYQYMLDEKILEPRIYAATDDGTVDGRPVFLSKQAWADKVKTQPSHILAAQMLQNPAAGAQAMFKKEWLRFADVRPRTLNVYVLCDPASSRKKGADSTAFAVWGIDAQGKKWLLDGARHKMQLSDRWAMLWSLRRKWQGMPGVQMVRCGYERYGMRSDIEYFEERMERAGESFEIVELAWPSDGTQSKVDRIQRLEPDFRNGDIWLPLPVQSETTAQRRAREAGEPDRIFKPIRRPDEQKRVYSFNQAVMDEFLVYPFAVHDDVLDAMSRIYDMDPVTPAIVDARALEPEAWGDS